MSPEIQQMAKEAQLGELHKVYSASNKENKEIGIVLIITGSIFLGIPLLIFFIFSFTDIGEGMTIPMWFAVEIIFSIVPASVLLLGCYLTFYKGVYPCWHVYIWQNGFIYEKGKVRQVFHWEQIDSIKGSISEVHGPVERTIYSYKVRHQDGTEIELTNVFPEIDELAGILLEEAVRQLAPHPVHVIDPERVVAFSNFTLDRQGISKVDKQASKQKGADKEQERVAWEEIRDVTIKAGTPIVRKAETET